MTLTMPSGEDFEDRRTSRKATLFEIHEPISKEHYVSEKKGYSWIVTPIHGFGGRGRLKLCSQLWNLDSRS